MRMFYVASIFKILMCFFFIFVLNTQHAFIKNSWAYPNTFGPITVNPAPQILVLPVPLRYMQMAIVGRQVFISSLQCA